MSKIKNYLREIRETEVFIFFANLLNRFLYNLMPLLIDIKSNDWMKYLRRKDNLIIALALALIIWNYFPSCTYSLSGGGGTSSWTRFYDNECLIWLAFVEKIQRTSDYPAVGHYASTALTLVSILFFLIPFFIAKYLLEIRIQNRRKRLK